MSPLDRLTEPARSAIQTSSAYAGWVRVDTDNVLRGWATDRNDRSARLTVDIFIEDEWIGSTIADRLDSKLLESGEGDGAYAFAMVIPAAFRDGRVHGFDARVRGDGFRLRSKIESFEIAADAPMPLLSVESAGYHEARGRLRGGQYTKSTLLELWRGSRRFEQPLPTRWSGPAGDLRFVVNLPAEAFEGEEEPLVLAAPGMIEAGLSGGPIVVDTSLSAEVDDTGRLTLRLTGRRGWLEACALELRLYADDLASPILKRSVSTQRDLHLELSPELSGVRLRASLAVDGREFPRLGAIVRRVPGRLTYNSSFQNWGPDGLSHWDIGDPGLEFDRGFYAFPPKVLEAQGLSGDLIHFRLLPAKWSQTLLRQVLTSTVMLEAPLEAALMARATMEATLHLRLLDGPGEEVGRVSLALPRSNAWVYVGRLVGGSGTAVAALEVSAEVASGGHIDIAGARLGGHEFRDAESSKADGVGAGGNAVCNADLRDWPHGILLTRQSEREEIARDWFVVNHHSTGPVFAAAVYDETASGRLGCAIAAEEVPEFCRIEMRLDEDIIGALEVTSLTFEAGAPSAARRLLRDSAAPLPEYTLIDRIVVMKRSPRETPGGYQLVDENLGVLARKVLLTRSPHAFEFQGKLDHMRNAPHFQWDEENKSQPAEFFLVFEFRRPFAVTLGNVRLAAAAPVSDRQTAERLALEDRSLAVQAEQVRGLKSWLSPEVQTANPVRDSEARVISRWRWSAAEMGALEVVVCVHDAVEETLACLRSLVACGETPHTVQIVDDASSPMTTARLEAFIADKPWMRLHRNPENVGYTGSADMAIRRSEAEWVVLLNSDTIVTPGWLEGLMAVVASDPKMAFVGPVSNAATFQSVPDLYDSSNQFKVNPLPPGWTPAQMAALVARVSDRSFPEVRLLNGFCTLMRRSVFLEVGGMNRTAFATGYGEENDLCTRVVKAGYRMAVADHVYVYHSKSASFGSVRRGELAKAGSKALRQLHPDVDYSEVTAHFREIPALVRLRAAVRDAIGAGESPPEEHRLEVPDDTVAREEAP